MSKPKKITISLKCEISEDQNELSILGNKYELVDCENRGKCIDCEVSSIVGCCGFFCDESGSITPHPRADSRNGHWVTKTNRRGGDCANVDCQWHRTDYGCNCSAGGIFIPNLESCKIFIPAADAGKEG